MAKTNGNSISVDIRAPWALCILFALWIVPGLFGRDPWKPDEGYTIGLVKHIADSGDWVVPALVGEPFMEKPPLFFITAALLGKAFSPWLMPLHQAMALAAALYIALLMAFAYLAGRERGGRAAGGTAVLGLIGCVGLVVRAHTGITDTALWCGFAAALYGLALSGRRRMAGAFWFGTGIGVAFMAKGFLGPAILSLAALFLPLFCPSRRGADYAKTLALAFVASLPWMLVWPLALYARSPALFHDWFWVNNVGRLLGASFGFQPPSDPGWLFSYLEIFPWFTLPLWPPALLLWVRRGRSALRDPGVVFPSLVLAAGFVLLGLASIRRELYFIPLLVPLALLAAEGGCALPARLETLLARIPLFIFGLGLAAIWILWAGWRSGASDFFNAKLAVFAPGLAEGTSLVALGAAGCYTLAWLYLRPRRFFRRDWALVWAAGLTALWGTACLLFMPILDYTNSYRGVFAEMAAHLPADRSARLDAIGFGESQRAILEYFFGWRARMIVGKNEPDGDFFLFEGFLRDPGEDGESVWKGDLSDGGNPSRRCIVLIQDEDWERIWRGRRPGDNNPNGTLALFKRRQALLP